MSKQSIALIGFGEVGQILAADLAAPERRISAWDTAFVEPASGPSKAVRHKVRSENAREAVSNAALVFSVVTAGEAQSAARSVAAAMKPGAIYVDFNSVSPKTKQETRSIVETAGGRFVEAAIMAPVPPRRLATPILLGGPYAEEFAEIAEALGVTDARAFSTEIGKASAAKMSRSIIVKGIEALVTESLLLARRYGVEAATIESLNNILPDPEWEARARYMISRSLLHGARRGEEMREAAKALKEAGIAPLMSAACATRQERAAQFEAGAQEADLASMLDALLDAQSDEENSLC